MKIKLTTLGELDSEQKKELLDVERNIFVDKLPEYYEDGVAEYLLEECDPDSPILMVYGNIVGFYFIQNQSLTDELDENFPDQDQEYNFLRYHYQGVTFGVDPQYRCHGFGEILKKIARMMFGPLWGYADERLDNLEYWLRDRDLLLEYEEEDGGKGYLTIDKR